MAAAAISLLAVEEGPRCKGVAEGMAGPRHLHAYFIQLRYAHANLSAIGSFGNESAWTDTL